MDSITQKKFIKVQTVARIEKDLRKMQKQLRRLLPKVQKAANNYNRMVKSYEQGQEMIKAMASKRDELLIEFKDLDKLK